MNYITVQGYTLYVAYLMLIQARCNELDFLLWLVADSCISAGIKYFLSLRMNAAVLPN